MRKMMQRMMPSLRLALKTIRVVVAKAERMPTRKMVKAKATIRMRWMTLLWTEHCPSVGKMEGGGTERPPRLRKVA